MNRVPPHYYGDFIKVPFGNPEADRALKRHVLRRFRALVMRFKKYGKPVIITDFQWFVNESKGTGSIEEMDKTYAWKCKISFKES